jgi:uncharacterized membrane protein YqhA
LFSRLLSLTRFIILIPVLGAWLAALISLGFGAYEIVLTVVNFFVKTVDPEKIVKLSVINLIEAVDLFLLGTAFYLISLGLYELFIDEEAPVPPWLVIHDLDDLKSKLISIIVVVLGVQFLAQVLNGKGDANLLPYGAAIALVILALAFFIGQKSRKHKNGAAEEQGEK